MTQTHASDLKATDNKTTVKHHRFTVTHVRPGDSDSGEVQYDVITAPSAAAARIRAAQIFARSRILAVAPVPEPLPVRIQQDTQTSPGARFIRGMFRPALFTDERELARLCS